MTKTANERLDAIEGRLDAIEAELSDMAQAVTNRGRDDDREVTSLDDDDPESARALAGLLAGQVVDKHGRVLAEQKTAAQLGAEDDEAGIRREKAQSFASAADAAPASAYSRPVPEPVVAETSDPTNRRDSEPATAG